MTRSAHAVYTIGYAGHTITSFINELEMRHIGVLLDIRRTPISRKKGFSKRALRCAVEAAGMTYIHLPQLGSPKELRVSLSTSKDYSAFFAEYRLYLSQQSQAVDHASEIAATHSTCLMCVEQHSDECHRSVVADAILANMPSKATVYHLPLAPRARGAAIAAEAV